MRVGEHILTWQKGLRSSTRTSWTKYIRMLDERVGSMELELLRASDVQRLVAEAMQEAETRRNNRNGSSAGEHMVAVSRSFLNSAMRDGLVQKNVALMISKPARKPTGRHALSKRQTAELFGVAEEREHWMLKWYLETGSRREGLIELKPEQVRRTTRTVKILEKNRKERILPISAELNTELAKPGSSLYQWTRRRLDGAWDRLNKATEWGYELGLSSHWMRHCAITRMERASSYAVAAEWAGHAQSSVTATYIQVGLPEVVCGWVAMVGAEHPLHECEDMPPWCTLR